MPGWNGVSLMLHPDWESSSDLQLYANASGMLGFGAYFDGPWLDVVRPAISQVEGDVCNCGSCSNKELEVAAKGNTHSLWQSSNSTGLAGQKIPKQTCGRKLFFLAAKRNCVINLKHIPGSKNELADATGHSLPKAGSRTIPAWVTKLWLKEWQNYMELTLSSKERLTRRCTRYSRFCKKYHVIPFPTTELTLCYSQPTSKQSRSDTVDL